MVGVGVVGVLLGRCMVVEDMGVRLVVEIFERARGPVGGLKGWIGIRLCRRWRLGIWRFGGKVR